MKNILDDEGIEPTTLSMRSSRSTNWARRPEPHRLTESLMHLYHIYNSNSLRVRISVMASRFTCRLWRSPSDSIQYKRVNIVSSNHDHDISFRYDRLSVLEYFCYIYFNYDAMQHDWYQKVSPSPTEIKHIWGHPQTRLENSHKHGKVRYRYHCMIEYAATRTCSV